MEKICRDFGVTASGEVVESWTLQNEFLTAEVLTYGASLRRLVFGGVDVVLGYDTLPEYEQNDGCLGATVGRVCNRIGGASFVLNGSTYPLAKNDGENHLHGGVRGFDKCVWTAEPLPDGLRLRRLSPDGEEGYPGALAVSVSYRLSGAALRGVGQMEQEELDMKSVRELTGLLKEVGQLLKNTEQEEMAGSVRVEWGDEVEQWSR